MSNFNIESVELRVKNMAIMKEDYSEKLKFHIISEKREVIISAYFKWK